MGRVNGRADAFFLFTAILLSRNVQLNDSQSMPQPQPPDVIMLSQGARGRLWIPPLALTLAMHPNDWQRSVQQKVHDVARHSITHNNK